MGGEIASRGQLRRGQHALICRHKGDAAPGGSLLVSAHQWTEAVSSGRKPSSSSVTLFQNLKIKLLMG